MGRVHAQRHMQKKCMVCQTVKPLRKFPVTGDECMSCMNKLDEVIDRNLEVKQKPILIDETKVTHTETGAKLTMTEQKPAVKPTPAPAQAPASPNHIFWPSGTRPETRVNVKAILAASRIRGSRMWQGRNVKDMIKQTCLERNIPMADNKGGTALQWAMEWMTEHGYATRTLSKSRRQTVNFTIKPNVLWDEESLTTLTQVEQDRANGIKYRDAKGVVRSTPPKAETKEVKVDNTPEPVIADPTTNGSAPLPMTPDEFFTPEYIVQFTTALKAWDKRNHAECQAWAVAVLNQLKNRA